MLGDEHGGLGETFDIHTGGVDLIFPHHEDEIAQSEAATGVEFVRTWLHCAHLQMGGTKMAKSTGNIARVSELLNAGVEPRALRYLLISVHYRMAIAYSDAPSALPAPRSTGSTRSSPLSAPTATTSPTMPRSTASSTARGPTSRRRWTTTSTSRPPWRPCSSSSAS